LRAVPGEMLEAHPACLPGQRDPPPQPSGGFALGQLQAPKVLEEEALLVALDLQDQSTLEGGQDGTAGAAQDEEGGRSGGEEGGGDAVGQDERQAVGRRQDEPQGGGQQPESGADQQ